MAIIQSIVFIQTAFLGDVLLTLPALRYLRKKYPGVAITFICRKGLGSVLKKLNAIEDYFEVEKGVSASYQSVLMALNGRKFDLLITSHESVRTSLFARKIQAKQKRGPKTFLNFFIFDERIQKIKYLPEPLRILQFCEVASLGEISSDQIYQLEKNHLVYDTQFASMSYREQILHWPETISMRDGFPENKKRILVFPGSVWETKKYTISSFISVISKLLQLGYEVVLMGAKNEVDLGIQIQSAISGEVKNLIGLTSLTQTLGLMVNSGWVIGNDSGSAHLAAAADCPSITIFGPTILEFGYRPWSNQSYIVQTRLDLKCRPCGSHGHQKCPIGTHECMKSIPPDDVVSVLSHHSVACH
ncbi:MAG: glycosyltransferase family 9 protein [Pseudobdellovibrionaceae bacterium]